ncbi:MAG: 2-hydroxyacyl-CoA dehydratase family protein [Candidatus Bathyarchaeia archaeon]
MVAEPFRTYSKIKEIADNYFKTLVEVSKKGNPVIWGPADIPYEILRAMDIYYVLGEPYGSMWAARGMAGELLPATENFGFKTCFCAYSRNFIGSYLTGKSPLEKLPRASFMVAVKAGCNDHIAWFEALSRIEKTPFFALDLPFSYSDPSERHIQYVQRQLENLVDFLERMTGRKMVEERLVKAVINAHKLRELWSNILEKLKNSPVPLNFRNQSSFMVAAVWLKGSDEAIEAYSSLLDELEDRIEKGIPAVTDEKVRLLWDNVPVWFYLKLFSYLESKGLILVVSPYMLGWGDINFIYSQYPQHVKDLFCWKTPETASDALRETAKQLLRIQLTTNSLDSKIHIYEAIARDYHVNGAIFHSNSGCKPLSLNRIEVARHLEKTLQIPVLVFESSMADPSGFNEVGILSQINKFATFFETRIK